MSEYNAATEPAQEVSLHVERWEGIWVRISVLLLVIFVIAITVAAVAYNIQVPGVGGRIDPNALDAPGSAFANPGVRELAPGKYEVHIVAQAWAFSPNPITVPQDAEVTFYVTSRDIQHGFKIQDTNINMMVLPGQISTLRTVFHTPGVYNIICHEYCGIAHHTMYGQLIVEPPGGITETVTTTVGAAETHAAITTTATLSVTEGGALTETMIMTGEAPVDSSVVATTTSAITETAAPTSTSALTEALSVTEATAITATTPVTETTTVTATATVTQ